MGVTCFDVFSSVSASGVRGGYGLVESSQSTAIADAWYVGYRAGSSGKPSSAMGTYVEMYIMQSVFSLAVAG